MAISAICAGVQRPLGDGGLAPISGMEMARFREIAYRLFGGLLLYPEEPRWTLLNEVARELLAYSEPLASYPFFASWQRLLIRLTMAEHRPLLAHLQPQFIRLFQVSLDSPVCHPYESFYLDPERHSIGWIALDLAQEYAAEGLALSPTFRDMPDHVAVEMEFMAFLCGREAMAWEQGETERARQILGRERAFLEAHLGRWLPRFAQWVMAADAGGFYATVLEAAEAFVRDAWSQVL